MGRITDTVKVLVVVNALFFVGTSLDKELFYGLFCMFYVESPFFKFWQPLTSMFMHANVMHIAFNMIALWMFGSTMEQVWGRKKFLFFYFSAGLGAAALHTLIAYLELHTNGLGIFNSESYLGILLGASGAVYGLLIAFAYYFPNAKLMLMFIPVPVAAKYFVPAVLALDLVFGFTGSPIGIAHWAHIGGAIVGFIMAYVWKKNSFNAHRWN